MSLAALPTRQREVAELIAEGMSNPEIAARVFLATETVKSHVATLLREYRVRNRTELAVAIVKSELHETFNSTRSWTHCDLVLMLPHCPSCGIHRHRVYGT